MVKTKKYMIEWDCFEDFGVFSPDEFLDDDGIDDDIPIMPPPSSAVGDQPEAMGSDTPLANPPVVPASAQLPPAVEDRSFSIVRSAEMNFDWEDLETFQLLYEIYGFVHPLPLPTQPSSLSDRDRSFLSTIVGLQRNDSDFLNPLLRLSLLNSWSSSVPQRLRKMQLGTLRMENECQFLAQDSFAECV